VAITTSLRKIEEAIKEPTFFKVIQGGASAGKTYAILTILATGYAPSYPNSLISIVGMSYPHLETGVMRDFKNILKEVKFWDSSCWNSTKKTYTFPNGSVIEFLSVDKMSARGPRRDVLFVNEANGINFETFDQLATRTRDFCIIDFNPSAKFWAHEELVEKRPEDTTFLILTFKDNQGLGERERQNILSRKPKPGEEPSNWWTVYGLGQIGSLEGNVYSGWEQATFDHFRQATKLVRYGLDFGFSNDETALVAIYEMDDGKTGVEEKIYQKGVLGSQYGELLERHNVNPNVLIVADSARPEIIAEIKKCGFRCIGADKNPGSVKRGIDRVQQRQIVFSGENLKREYLSYSWRKKRTGEVLDEPQDGNDHLMDALRYAIDDLSRPKFDF
jgi:phage terminase large subunit